MFAVHTRNCCFNHQHVATGRGKIRYKRIPWVLQRTFLPIINPALSHFLWVGIIHLIMNEATAKKYYSKGSSPYIESAFEHGKKGPSGITRLPIQRKSSELTCMSLYLLFTSQTTTIPPPSTQGSRTAFSPDSRANSSIYMWPFVLRYGYGGVQRMCGIRMWVFISVTGALDNKRASNCRLTPLE